MEQKKLKEAKEVISHIPCGTNARGRMKHEAYKTAIECIKKQMPKELIAVDDGLCECPACHNRWFYIKKPDWKYCQECGQRLEWGDE